MELKNGAQVLASKEIPANGYSNGNIDGHVVLALRQRKYGPEYVTWVTDPDGNAFWGHYYGDVIEATKDFEDRTALMC